MTHRYGDNETKLTVGRLRELLKDLPDDMAVDADGCDCIGVAVGLVVDSGRCLIVRDENVVHYPEVRT